jgi:hypothetical protein
MEQPAFANNPDVPVIIRDNLLIRPTKMAIAVIMKMGKRSAGWI